ncbi:MAG: hypothetical protein M3P83_04910, partial [Actinomycetota bacterium]|nr:hypothetical protein [Actinomycetota bacterium]
MSDRRPDPSGPLAPPRSLGSRPPDDAAADERSARDDAADERARSRQDETTQVIARSEGQAPPRPPQDDPQWRGEQPPQAGP